jgi:hypothetical protein
MRINSIPRLTFLGLIAVAVLGCSSAPEKTDAQKSFEETQQRIKDVQSSMTSVSLPPRVAPEGWAKDFCSLDFGYERERVRDILGEPSFSGLITDLNPDQGVELVSQDVFEAGAYKFNVEYDAAGTAQYFYSFSSVPCDSSRTNKYGSQP